MRNYLLPISLVSLIGISSSAVALTLPENEYHQDFAGYDSFFDRGSWGLIDDESGQFRVPYPYSSLNQTEKAAYSVGSLLIFDARWRRTTLKAMLDEQFKPLVKDDGVKPKEIRQALDAADCKAFIEVGTSNTYGFPAGSNVIELDSDTYKCQAASIDLSGTDANNAQPSVDKSGKPSALRIRTFIPTIPGATYTFDVYYNKRLNSANRFDDNDVLIAKVRAKSFDSVIVDGYATPIEDSSFEGGRINLPFDIAATDYDGFYKATIKYVAQDYFTRVILRGNDASDSFGPLINKVHSTKISVPQEQYDMCSMFYEYGSKNFKQCMHAEGDDYNFACNFKEAQPDFANGVKYIVKKEGGNRDNSKPERYEPLNMSVTTRVDGSGSLGTFYSVGLGGKTAVKLNCPVGGKTLELNEFTNGANQDIESYPEQGIVKAKIKCLDENNSNNGWLLLTADSEDQDGRVDDVLLTNEYLTYEFPTEGFKGCRMTKLVFIDKTADLESPAPGSDGFEIQGLQFVETPE